MDYKTYAFKVTVFVNGVSNHAYVLLHISRPLPLAKASEEITISTFEQFSVHAGKLADFYMEAGEEITDFYSLEWRCVSGESFCNSIDTPELSIPPNSFQGGEMYEIQLISDFGIFSIFVNAIAAGIPELVLTSNLDFLFNPGQVNLLDASLIPYDDPRDWAFQWSFPTLNVKYPDPLITEFHPTSTSALLKIASKLDPGNFFFILQNCVRCIDYGEDQRNDTVC